MTTSKKPMIYVSGPMAGAPGSSYTSNIRLGIDVANDLERHGAHPYLPHTNALWGICYPGKDYATIIERDLAFVEVCDALVRIPGESKGADAEVEHARKLGIPVFDLDVFQSNVVSGIRRTIHNSVRENDALWTFIEQFKPETTAPSILEACAHYADLADKSNKEVERLKAKVHELEEVCAKRWDALLARDSEIAALRAGIHTIERAAQDVLR